MKERKTKKEPMKLKAKTIENIKDKLKADSLKIAIKVDKSLARVTKKGVEQKRRHKLQSSIVIWEGFVSRLTSDTKVCGCLSPLSPLYKMAKYSKLSESTGSTSTNREGRPYQLLE